jgi:hypothetical protein
MKTLNLIPALLCLASCSPVLYSPTTQNVPLLKEKGEVNIGGGLAFNDYTEGLSLNLAVAVDSGWAVAGTFNSMSEDSDSDWESRGKYIEGAVGRFGTVDHSPFVYEAFLGMGYGTLSNESGNNRINGNFIKPYLQPSFGIRSKIVHLVFTPRFAVVNYVSNRVAVYDNPQQEISARNFFEDKGTSFVFEPGVTLRLGLENVKLELQYVYSTFSYQSDGMFDLYNNIWNLGLNFYLR